MPNSEYQKLLAPCGADWATSMDLSWKENPTDQDGLLLKNQTQSTETISTTSLLLRGVGEDLSPIRGSNQALD